MEIKLLSCPVCLHPHFSSVDSLRTALINVASAPIPCPICSEVLLGLDKLTIHLFSHVTFSITINTSAGTTSECQISNLGQIGTTGIFVQKKLVTIAPAAVTTKNNVIETSNQPCTIAGTPQIQQATPISVLSSDPAVNTDNSAASIQCDICNFRFNDQSILEMHQKLLHQTLADSKTGAYSYHCHLCSKRFKMKGSLMVHLRVAHAGFGCHTPDDSCHTGSSNQVDDEDAIKEAVKSTIEGEGVKLNSGGKHWVCDICEKSFTTKYFLKKHKRLHTGEMPYYCHLCNKSFTFQQSFHKHLLYHSAEKPHVCAECGRAFKELSTLHNHERIHSGERPFACETCGKCFRQRVSYLVHRRIHTGVMPYVCITCKKSFRYKVSLKSHKCASSGTTGVELELRTSPTLTAATDRSAEYTENDRSHAFDLANEQITTNIFETTANDHEKAVLPTDSDISFHLTSNEDGTAYYAMVLSPNAMLPDVQSLCLTSGAQSPVSVDSCHSSSDVTVSDSCRKTIDEESLKQLLYGGVL